jgi:hypothetical protein
MAVMSDQTLLEALMVFWDDGPVSLNIPEDVRFIFKGEGLDVNYTYQQIWAKCYHTFTMFLDPRRREFDNDEGD